MWLINLKGAPSAPIIEDASKIAQYSVMAGTSTHKKQLKSARSTARLDSCGTSAVQALLQGCIFRRRTYLLLHSVESARQPPPPARPSHGSTADHPPGDAG